jgi:hypothetical protein
MPAITGSDTFFTNIDDEFTATKWEACIEQAIDKINGYAKDDILPNMAGVAGSKTVNVTSGQAGFIRDLAVAIYANGKAGGASSSSIGIGSLSMSSSSNNTSQSANMVDQLAKDAAACLKEIEVSYG